MMLTTVRPDTTQSRLQQIETLLKLLERTAFIGVWSLDLATDELAWSDQLAAMHDAPRGYTPGTQ